MGKLGRAAAAALSIGAAGCSLEQDYDGQVPADGQAACEPCAKPFTLGINSHEGGRVECAGGVLSEFPEGAKVEGLCADNAGFVFRVITGGKAEYTAFDDDGKPVTVEFDLSGDEKAPELGSKFSALNGGTVSVEIPE